ncbi:MAG TPA: FAD:protein FMN transferase [Prolixibacteraceae bacterium]|nr:FAD:protein FMN transferase [Prolixibacteraceae bacterium]
MWNKVVTGNLLILGFFLVGLTACQEKKELKIYKMSGAAQGTYYAITYCSDSNQDLQPAIDSLLRQFDQSVSAYLPTSILSRLNNNDSTAVADSIFEYVFKKALEISAISGGAFDMTVGPLVNAWGFGFSKKEDVDQAMVDSLLQLVGYQKVQLVNGKLSKADPRIRIDFDAIAQGYSTDWLAKFFEKQGINNYLIDVGGEVLGHGTKPDGQIWSVAIEKPSKNSQDERKIQAILSLKNQAISTSGNYRKYYEENGVRYSHTIDPSNGFPVRHNLLSVSVLAGDCITADAYATAFMVMGLEKAKEFLSDHRDIEAYFISDDQQGGYAVFYTPGFEKLLKKN